MPLDRAQGQAALKRVLEAVMDLDPNSPVHRALSKDGRTDIRDVAVLTDLEIDNLTCDGADGSQQPLTGGSRGLLRAFRSFVYYRSTIGQPIGDAWDMITQDEFDDFRVGPEYFKICRGDAPRPSATPTPKPSAPRNLLNGFCKGSERNAVFSPSLQNGEKWDHGQRSIVQNVRATEEADILAADSSPKPCGEKTLSKPKKWRTSYVLEKTLVTDQEKVNVDDVNAKKLVFDFSKHAMKSTKVSLDTSKLLNNVSSTCVDDGSLKGTSHSLALLWQSQRSLSERQAAALEQIPSASSPTMLANTVREMVKLRQAKALDEQTKAQSGGIPTHEKCAGLIASEPKSYDSQLTPKSHHAVRAPKRIVRGYSLFPADDDGMGERYSRDSFILKSDVVSPEFSANVPRDRWRRLLNDAQTPWATLSNEPEQTLLGLHLKPHPPTHCQSHSPNIGAYAFIAVNLHDLRLGSEGDVDDADKEPESPADSSFGRGAFLANASKRENPPSAEHCTVLFRNVLRYSGKTNPDVPNMETILVDKVFWEVSVARTICVSVHKTALYGSLTDRSMNSGVTQEDFRVADTLDRCANIRGIGSQQITAIPMVSCGNVARSKKGDATLILRQYKYTVKDKTFHTCGQIEAYVNDVKDRSVKVAAGLQRIRTSDGHVFPLSTQDGLPYLRVHPFKVREWDESLHVIVTSDQDWDPSVLDHVFDEDDDWFDSSSDSSSNLATNFFDEFGIYRKRVIFQETFFDVAQAMPDNLSAMPDNISVNLSDNLEKFDVSGQNSIPNMKISVDPVKTVVTEPPMAQNNRIDSTDTMKIFKSLDFDPTTEATQFAKNLASTVLKENYKSPFVNMLEYSVQEQGALSKLASGCNQVVGITNKLMGSLHPLSLIRTIIMLMGRPGRLKCLFLTLGSSWMDLLS